MTPLRPLKNRARGRAALNASTLALVVSLAIAVPQAVASDDVTPPPVPGNLQVPDGHVPYLVGHASGTQDYICMLASGGFTWAFFGPQATLFNADSEQLTTHFLSPNPVENGVPRATWRDSRDTSTVWAAAIANSSDQAFVAPGAIPWLLLRVVGAQYGPAWGDTLTATTFIQRVNTVGGVAPATGCSQAAHIGRKALVPYTTDYIFYRQ